MKTFKKYLMREEVEVAPYVKSGSIDIDDPSVRDNINTLLHGVTGRCFITPYIALERIAKVLNNFHIHVPKTTFLENDSGMVSFNISQFGNKFGMQNNGEVVTKNTSPFHLYFEYRMNEKGLFDVFCEILDETELEEIMNDLHDEMNDSTDDDDETEEIETASDMRNKSLHEQDIRQSIHSDGVEKDGFTARYGRGTPSSTGPQAKPGFKSNPAYSKQSSASNLVFKYDSNNPPKISTSKPVYKGELSNISRDQLIKKLNEDDKMMAKANAPGSTTRN